MNIFKKHVLKRLKLFNELYFISKEIKTNIGDFNKIKLHFVQFEVDQCTNFSVPYYFIQLTLSM